MKLYAIPIEEKEEIQISKNVRNIIGKEAEVSIVSVGRGASLTAELISLFSSGVSNVSEHSVLLATLLSPLAIAHLKDIPKKYIEGLKIITDAVDLLISDKSYRDIRVDLNTMYTSGLIELFKHKETISPSALSFTYYSYHQGQNEFITVDFDYLSGLSTNEILDSALDAQYAIIGLPDFAVKIDRRGKASIIHKE